jgi:hypothetical protein
MAIPNRPCIALIADMLKSRELTRSQRPGVQQRFQELVVFLNEKYHRHILAKFVITLGDEFQGLLRSATPIPDLLWDIDCRFSDRRLRVGLGFGLLDTPLQKEAVNIDGPALHFARAAIEIAAEKRSYGGVFLGFADMDSVLNGIARILSFHRSRLTAQQLEIAELLRQGRTQSEAARELQIFQQVVSKQVLAFGWWPYTEAESAWRILFERYVNPNLEKHHAKLRRQ